MIGPRIVVSEDAAAQIPIAQPRRSRGYAAAMIARLPGTISAAPAPCTARAAISSTAVGATAEITEAATKMTMPMANTRLHPEAVARRTAQKQQRRQQEKICVGDPLRVGKARSEIGADRRYRNRKHRAVDEPHRGGKDRCHQDEDARFGRTERVARRDCRCIAHGASLRLVSSAGKRFTPERALVDFPPSP